MLKRNIICYKFHWTIKSLEQNKSILLHGTALIGNSRSTLCLLTLLIREAGSGNQVYIYLIFLMLPSFGSTDGLKENFYTDKTKMNAYTPLKHVYCYLLWMHIYLGALLSFKLSWKVYVEAHEIFIESINIFSSKVSLVLSVVWSQFISFFLCF